MANIWITEKDGKYKVTVDEYPKISFTEKTYNRARNKAVDLVKKEICKNLPVIIPEEEQRPTKVKFGFAA